MAEQYEIWGVKDPNISSQLALAMKLDLFNRHAGLSVSCKFIESGTTMPKDVLEAEKKPFAFMQTPITAILLHDKGFSTKIIAPLADIAGTQQVIVREETHITSPKELEEKRIGMAKGAAIQIALTNMAKDCNIDIDKMYFINLLPHDQIVAFQEGKLDAVACWEPWTTKALEAGGKFYFSGSKSAIPGIEGDVSWLINQSCLMVPDAHLEQEAVILAILRVLREATHLINLGFKEVFEILAEFFGMPENALRAIMSKNTYAMTMDNLFRIGILTFRDFLADTGRLSVQLSEEQLYTPDFLQEVDSFLVTLGAEAAQRVKTIEREGIYYQEDMVFSGDTSTLRFLFADDSQVVRTILGQVIDLLGGEVVGEAQTGNEAIKKFTELRPNFVTMDLSMPGLSGVDAIRQILQIDPNVNIIVISGLKLQEVREEVLSLGAKMYLPKPFDPERAAAVIRSILEQ